MYFWYGVLVLILSIVPPDVAESKSQPRECKIVPHNGAVSEPPSPETSTSNLDHLNPNSKLFTISAKINSARFPIQVMKYASKVMPPKGTVIYLCGGPSPCIIGKPKNVPTDVDVVAFDYLGLGRNTLHSSSPELRSIESQAVAVKEILKALKLKNYVLYGHSFGTAVTTVAAAMIGQDRSLLQPKSVILEGVLGPRRSGFVDFSGASQRAWSLLSESEREKYRETIKQALTKYPELAAKIADKMAGWQYDGARKVAEGIRGALKLPLSERIENLNKWLTRSDLSESDSSIEREMVYRAAGCQSGRRVDKRSFIFESGLIYLKPDGDTYFCKCRTVRRDYDPGKFQIKAPIIYVNGDSDPATPIENAKMHFSSQNNQNKIFISIKDGGHANTFSSYASCVDSIYNAAFEGELTQLTGLNRGCAPGGPKDIDSAIK